MTPAERLIVEPALLSDCLAAAGRGYGAGADLMGVATQWSKFYLRLLVPEALSDAVAGTGRDRSAAAVAVLLKDGLPERVRLAAHSTALAPDAALQTLFDHLDELALALTHVAGLPRKVLWSNAGNLVEYVLSDPEHRFSADERASARAWSERLIGERSTPWFVGANPLFNPVHYGADADGMQIRRRRVCCLRYRISGVPLCEGCPRPPSPPQGASTSRSTTRSASRGSVSGPP